MQWTRKKYLISFTITHSTQCEEKNATKYITDTLKQNPLNIKGLFLRQLLNISWEIESEDESNNEEGKKKKKKRKKVAPKVRQQIPHWIMMKRDNSLERKNTQITDLVLCNL